MQILAGAAVPVGWCRDELGLGFSRVGALGALGALGAGVWNSWLLQV